MVYPGRGRFLHTVLTVVLSAAVAAAQSPSPEDQNIDPIRTLTAIGPADQRVIAEWIQAKLAALSAESSKDPNAALTAARTVFTDLYNRGGNTPAFQTEFTRQATDLFAAQWSVGEPKPAVDRALARILVDLNRVETVPALLAGMKSRDSATRFLCARALAAQRTAVASDREQWERVLAAVRQAGAAETDAVVIGQLYAILAHPQQAAQVIDPMLGIMERRLEVRRSAGLVEDGAELQVYEFLRTPGVLNALTPEQKNRLVQLLAGLLRFDAERYSAPQLSGTEVELITRSLDGIESILVDLGLKGGDIRNELSLGGHERRGEVLQQAHLWIGDKEANKPGTLNAAPYNVPLGAM